MDFLASVAIHLTIFLLAAWLVVRPLYFPWVVGIVACGLAYFVLGYVEGRRRFFRVQPFFAGLLSSMVVALVLVGLVEAIASSPNRTLGSRQLAILLAELTTSTLFLAALVLSAATALTLSGIGFTVGSRRSRR
jgi:hypothetical protein